MINQNNTSAHVPGQICHSMGGKSTVCAPFTVTVYMKYAVSRGDTPSLDSFLSRDGMEGFLAHIQVSMAVMTARQRG